MKVNPVNTLSFLRAKEAQPKTDQLPNSIKDLKAIANSREKLAGMDRTLGTYLVATMPLVFISYLISLSSDLVPRVIPDAILRGEVATWPAFTFLAKVTEAHNKNAAARARQKISELRQQVSVLPR